MREDFRTTHVCYSGYGTEKMLTGRRVAESARNSRIAHVTHGIHQFRMKSCASPKVLRPTS